MSGTGDRHALILVPHSFDPEAPKLDGEYSIGLFDPNDRQDFENAVGHLRERAFKVPHFPEPVEKVWRTYDVITETEQGGRHTYFQQPAVAFLWVEGSKTNELELQGDDGRVVGYFDHVVAVYEVEDA